MTLTNFDRSFSKCLNLTHAKIIFTIRYFSFFVSQIFSLFISMRRIPFQFENLKFPVTKQKQKHCYMYHRLKSGAQFLRVLLIRISCNIDENCARI